MASYTSYFIDRAAAEKAVQFCLPMINAGMESRVAGESGFLYVVIMRPGATPDTCSFEEAVLHEQAVFGDRAKWDADYAAFARAKARVSWKTGLDGHMVQELKPHLLERGDTVLWGSIVLDGIVVAVSGADAWYDEMFANAIAMCLRAQAKAGIAKARKSELFLKSE
jgi:hypothetical protein